MEKEERKRYSRQIILPDIGLAGQEKLKAAKILVIGAGGLGCPLLQYLVAAGIGTVGVVDNDTVDISNLHRQILFSAADIGQNKAQTAVSKLAVLNPHVNLLALTVKLTADNAVQLISDYDLVVDGSDNFPTRYLVDDTCVALGKPMIFGSILRFEGQVSVFNYKGGPTYRCLFPDAEETEGENCAEAGVLGILPGIIGSYMANEVIKVICEIGEPLSGKLLIINVLTNTNQIFNFTRSASYGTEFTKETSVSKSEVVIAEEMVMEILEMFLAREPEKIYLIDVREEYEFEEDFIGGVNIPLPDLPGKLDQIPTDKILAFYCHSGKRSKIAANMLAMRGYAGKSFWVKRP